MLIDSKSMLIDSKSMVIDSKSMVIDSKSMLIYLIPINVYWRIVSDHYYSNCMLNL